MKRPESVSLACFAGELAGGDLPHALCHIPESCSCPCHRGPEAAGANALLALALEVRDHLYTLQDIARCREMARAAVAAFEEK